MAILSPLRSLKGGYVKSLRKVVRTMHDVGDLEDDTVAQLTQNSTAPSF